MLRILPSLALCALALVAPAHAQAPASGDPLKAPACVAARSELDAAEAASPRVAANVTRLRQQVARICLQGAADTPPPARVAQPPLAVPPAARVPAPRLPSLARAPSVTPMPATGPAQVTRCDDGGCFDNQGARLNRFGNTLVGPKGMCTQQGTVLVCP